METPSSILIILASVFSSVEKFSFPHHFFFLFSPRETSLFEALPSLFPTLSRSPLRSFAFWTQRKFSFHRAYIFDYSSRHFPSFPSQQGSNVPRVSFSCSLRPCSFRHRRCPASALFEIRQGRGEKWSSGSRRGKKRRKHGNDPREELSVCVRARVCAWREKHAALELICPSNHLPRTHLDGWRFTRVWSILGIGVEKNCLLQGWNNDRSRRERGGGNFHNKAAWFACFAELQSEPSVIEPFRNWLSTYSFRILDKLVIAYQCRRIFLSVDSKAKSVRFTDRKLHRKIWFIPRVSVFSFPIVSLFSSVRYSCFFLFFCFPFLIHGKKRKFHPLKHYTFPSQTNQLPFSNNLLHLTLTKKKKKSHRSNLLKSDIRWYHRPNFLPLSFNVQSFASVACKYRNMHGKRGVQRLSSGAPSLISATPDSRAQ